MRSTVFSALAVACLAGAASADVYNDPAQDVFTGAGGGILDILSMEVTNDATSISFRFTLAGDIVATDWGKYMVLIDSQAGGDSRPPNPGAGFNGPNGWNRPIGLSGQQGGGDFWIGSWADGGNGAELYRFGDGNGGFNGWYKDEATYNAAPDNDISVAKTTNTFTITTLLSNLGLEVGEKIFFDAFTSGGGGGDGAIDSAANPNQSVSDWGNFYMASHDPDNGRFLLSYTIVPAPATLAVLGVGGLIAGRRRR